VSKQHTEQQITEFSGQPPGSWGEFLKNSEEEAARKFEKNKQIFKKNLTNLSKPGKLDP
jgi:hypothetical protein